MPRLTIRITDSLLGHYQDIANREERTVSDVIRRTLRRAAERPIDPEEGKMPKTMKLKLKP